MYKRQGIIFSRARLIMKPTAAVICQAAIFAAMYGAGINMAVAFILGLVLGLAALQAKSIWAPVVMRMVFSAVTTIADFYYDAIFASGQATMSVIAVSGAVFVLAGFFYFRNEGMTPDNQKHSGE